MPLLNSGSPENAAKNELARSVHKKRKNKNNIRRRQIYLQNRHRNEKYRKENAERIAENNKRCYEHNKPERLEKARQYRELNREQIRAWFRKYDIKRNYGITIEQYVEMFDAQGRACAICGGGCTHHKRLSVDHDHKTGKVRGLLCDHCNRGLGYFRDDPKLLVGAAEYLRANGNDK